MGSDDKFQKPSNTVKFMITGMLSLVGVAVIIIILQICARHLHRRQERRRRTILYALGTTGVASISEVVETELPKNGLDPLTIETLPLFNYKANRFNHVEPIECSVCLSTIIEEAKIRLLPNCMHLFHVNCIDLWLRSHTTCPNCRALAEPKVEPEQSTGLDTTVQPTAPPLEPEESAQLEKTGGSCLRSSPFQRMISYKERSNSRRPQSCGEEVGAEDLERQPRMV